jgi:hypothetical protein
MATAQKMIDSFQMLTIAIIERSDSIVGNTTAVAELLTINDTQKAVYGLVKGA